MDVVAVYLMTWRAATVCVCVCLLFIITTGKNNTDFKMSLMKNVEKGILSNKYAGFSLGLVFLLYLCIYLFIAHEPLYIKKTL